MPKLRFAGIILVLLSPAYLSSEYCCQEELPRALKMKRSGDALVFLIHLKTLAIPVMLQQFQILPSDRQSVSDVRNRGEVLANIVRQIRKEISDSPSKQSAGQVVRKHIPVNLPYLCNRTPQEQTLEFLVQKPQLANRPCIFVLTGPNRECHQAFHERIAAEFLPALFGFSPNSKVDPLPFDWPRYTTPGSDCDSSFAFRVKQQIDAPSTVATEMVRSLPEQLIFLTTSIPGDEWSKHQSSLLDCFLKYWNQ